MTSPLTHACTTKPTWRQVTQVPVPIRWLHLFALYFSFSLAPLSHRFCAQSVECLYVPSLLSECYYRIRNIVIARETCTALSFLRLSCRTAQLKRSVWLFPLLSQPGLSYDVRVIAVKDTQWVRLQQNGHTMKYPTTQLELVLVRLRNIWSQQKRRKQIEGAKLINGYRLWSEH